MKKETCPCCGQSIMKHKHSLSLSMVKILVTVERHPGMFHLQKDVALSKNQYANFQKLKYWGLTEQVVGKSGYWNVTQTGKDFLCSRIELPRSVWTFNNRVVEVSKEKISIRHYTTSLLESGWKQRHEYGEDATKVSGVGQQELFETGKEVSK